MRTASAHTFGALHVGESEREIIQTISGHRRDARL
jgi:hypothetical protein